MVLGQGVEPGVLEEWLEDEGSEMLRLRAGEISIHDCRIAQCAHPPASPPPPASPYRGGPPQCRHVCCRGFDTCANGVLHQRLAGKPLGPAALRPQHDVLAVRRDGREALGRIRDVQSMHPRLTKNPIYSYNYITAYGRLLLCGCGLVCLPGRYSRAYVPGGIRLPALSGMKADEGGMWP